MYHIITLLAVLICLVKVDAIIPISAKPSRAPTVGPTADPTVDPTQNPTESPTSTPSAQPSNRPSTSPTAAPSISFHPTSMPTSNELPRYYQCSDLICQGNSATDCYYTTGNVILEVSIDEEFFHFVVAIIICINVRATNIPYSAWMSSLLVKSTQHPW